MNDLIRLARGGVLVTIVGWYRFSEPVSPKATRGFRKSVWRNLPCLRHPGSRTWATRGVLVAVAAALTASAGCGDGRPARVPVSGRVLIDGKPLTHGFIRLIPSEGRPANGEIGPDGRFTLTTFEPGDGAVAGTHKVMILAAEPLSSTKQRWHAPKKYTNPDQSGLTATVDGPTDSLLVELSWDGGKPFIEIINGGE